MPLDELRLIGQLVEAKRSEPRPSSTQFFFYEAIARFLCQQFRSKFYNDYRKRSLSNHATSINWASLFLGPKSEPISFNKP
ncbi:hypothetical protein Csa_018035 [Cucumis sativus]|uniref:Uncharacterized protein n=1 Tax=Cucumis sativus TaxID=3659 RepID=A0A0A0KXD4_CUCSA|nr:hypothetical protein Csa_018035 [Cucumis sativus]